MTSIIGDLNTAINEDGLVTNQTEQTLAIIVQNDDKNMAIASIPPGETAAVEAVLIDVSNNGLPDHAARIYNGAGLPSHFAIIGSPSEGYEIVNPNKIQGVINGLFDRVAQHMHSDRTYLDFIPMDEFLEQNANCAKAFEQAYGDNETSTSVSYTQVEPLF